MEIIQLTRDNLSREVLDILAQLAPTKKLTLKRAKDIIDRQIAASHYTYILIDDFSILATASIIIIDHLIHNGKTAALIENVAVRKDSHGKGYGAKLIKFLKRIARKHRCYKITLNCSKENIPFYEKCGFSVYCDQMRVDLIK